MPKDPLPQGRTIEENLEILVDEIKLALQWDRPSILLVIYRSKFGQVKLQKALELKLGKIGQACLHFEVGQEEPNILPRILKAPDRKRTVFFVSNIERGGPAAYQALNLYRESFIENQIRAVFWLTPNEGAKLPHQAPDFWAFRHQTVEFTRRQAPQKIHLPAGLLLWPVRDSARPAPNLPDQIQVREKLLAGLPHTAESTSSRMELLAMLGFLKWVSGNAAAAEEDFKQGLRVDGVRNFPTTESQLWNGLGILAYEAGKVPEAVQAFQTALERNPRNSEALMNLAVAYCAQGQKEKAVSLAKRAAAMDERDARVWHALGTMYAALGRADDAQSCLARSVELAPGVAEYHLSLAIQCSEMEDQVQAARQMKLAGERLERPDANFDIVEQALAGDLDRALSSLRQALQTGQVSRLEVERSPILNKLFDLSQI